MSVKLSNLLKEVFARDSVDSSFKKYEGHHSGEAQGSLEKRKSDYQDFIITYYNLVTDFFEYGWGQSFHFAPRGKKESFLASITRHEHYLAHMLGLRPGMRVIDLGCGIGGSLREIARFSGAKIVGVSNNAYHLKRAHELMEEAGITHRVEYLLCDFMNVDAPDSSFDAVYSIEATCCAPNKTGVYGEAFRLLKPGACFAAYEYCLTDRFDAEDPHHLQIKKDIEIGGGLLDIEYQHQIDDALRAVGFELLETRDLAIPTCPAIPWYQPLVGSGFSLASFRSSSLGRSVTHSLLGVLETLRIVPRGTLHVSKILNSAAIAFAEAGRLGIFTPMYFFHARKPE